MGKDWNNGSWRSHKSFFVSETWKLYITILKNGYYLEIIHGQKVRDYSCSKKGALTIMLSKQQDSKRLQILTTYNNISTKWKNVIRFEKKISQSKEWLKNLSLINVKKRWYSLLK